uniref:Uncharacterized protein n=1 Tax=Theileria annulata TaxID=5874 RepID=A0A3B0MR07_THEAN
MENNENDNSLRQFQLLQETQSQIEVLNNQIAKINKHISNQKIKNKRAEAALESEELKKEVESERDSTALDLPKLESVKNQLVAKLGGLNTQMDLGELTLKTVTPKFRVHLFLLVVFVHSVCDLLKALFKRLGKLMDDLNVKFGGPPGEKLTLKDAADMSKIFRKENFRPFKLLKGVTLVLAFLAEFLLPYCLFNKTTSVLKTNFQKQVDSYSPFALVTCKLPEHPRFFLKSKAELDRLMEEDYKEESSARMNVFDFFASLSDMTENTDEAMKERLEEHVKQNSLKLQEEFDNNIDLRTNWFEENFFLKTIFSIN